MTGKKSDVVLSLSLNSIKGYIYKQNHKISNKKIIKR